MTDSKPDTIVLDDDQAAAPELQSTFLATAHELQKMVSELAACRQTDKYKDRVVDYVRARAQLLALPIENAIDGIVVAHMAGNSIDVAMGKAAEGSEERTDLLAIAFLLDEVSKAVAALQAFLESVTGYTSEELGLQAPNKIGVTH